MIPALIVMLMRRYQKNNPQQFLIIKERLLYAIKIMFFITVAFLIVVVTRGQEKNLAYTVKKNGNKIGHLCVKEIKQGTTVSLKMQSDIKTSFVLTFSARGIEEAKFDSGILVYSSVYQKLNGNEKINKQIRFVNDAYVISNNGKEEILLSNIKIYYNLVCIYGHEPVTATMIFSDKYQRFLPIQKIGDHHYQIQFPDGANDYWFENGVCKKIEVDHKLYSAVMELIQ